MWTNVAIYRILKITDSCSDSKEGQVIWIFDFEISPSRNETKVIKRLENPGLLRLSFNGKIDAPVKMIHWKCYEISWSHLFYRILCMAFFIDK